MIRALLWLIPAITFVVGWSIGTPGNADGTNASTVPISNITEPSPGSAAGNSLQAPPKGHRRLEAIRGYPSSLRQLVESRRLVNQLDAEGLAALYGEMAGSRSNVDEKLRVLLFRRWAKIAPEAAIVAAQAADMLYPALRGWAEKDPLAALAWCDEHLPKPESGFLSLRNDVLEFAIPKPGDFPPLEAIRRIRALPVIGDTPPGIDNGIAEILRDWATKDPEAAWQAALTSEDLEKSRGWALSTLLYSRAASNPARCKEWVEAMPEGPDRNEAIASLASALAWNSGIDAGRLYALALSEGVARQHAVANIARVIQSRDRQGLGPFMAGLKPSDIQDPTLFEEVFTEWYRSDASRAGGSLLAHLTSLTSSSKNQDRKLDHLLFSWRARDPENASEFSLRLPEDLRAKYLPDALTNYVGRDAPAAAKWATEIPETDLRDQALGIIVKTWTSQSIPRVTEWLNHLPANAGKPAAVEAFAQTLISTAPDDALTWLRALPDERDRLARLNRIWNTWLDRAAADRWRDTSPSLSSTERGALQRSEKATLRLNNDAGE